MEYELYKVIDGVLTLGTPEIVLENCEKLRGHGPVEEYLLPGHGWLPFDSRANAALYFGVTE